VPVITQIKQQKNKNRVNVYLDGKFGFGIDLENFVKLHLRVEQELTEKQIAEIVKKSEFQKTLGKLLKFAMMRPRSEKEIRSWLWRKKVAEVMYKDYFSRLKHFELIDDEKFARWWVEQRREFSPRAERIIKQELLIKGIKREIIDDVLGESKVDEVKVAVGLLSKKKSGWKALGKEVLARKSLEFLLRKGFGWEVARKAVKEYNIGEDVNEV